jgi:hypothetical protein
MVGTHGINSYNNSFIQRSNPLIFFLLQNLFAFIGAAIGADPMRHLGLLTLRTEGHPGSLQTVMRTAKILFGLGCFSLGYSHNFSP